MPVLVYAPAVEVLIDSKRLGVVDVTNDLVRGRMELSINRPHAFQFSMMNPRRKYDRLFRPNDRIVVRMKRLRWLQTFAGYLDQVPLFSVHSRSISMSASCTLKRLQFRYWDPATIESEFLLHEDDDPTNIDIDGGMKRKALRLLTEVAGWPEEHVHVAEVPGSWVTEVSDLYDALGDRIGVNQAMIGTGASLYGRDVQTGPTTIAVNGTNPFVGMLPSSSGKISAFGGPNGGAFGPMELTGEPGGTPSDGFYCAMRFPYKIDDGSRPAKLRLAGTQAQVDEARRWWKNRRLLITNPANGKQCVVRCADWGPAKWTGKTIDTAPQVHAVLGCSTNDEVNIGFAPENAPLGLYSNQNALAVDLAGGNPTNAHGGGSSLPATSTPTGAVNLPKPLPAGTTSISGAQMAWGGYTNGNIPDSAMATVTDPRGRQVKMHPLAGAAYERMRDAALKDGIKLDIGGCYRSYAAQVTTRQNRGNMAAKPGTSNHGWGMAIDFEGGINSYSSPAHLWMAENGPQFGWVLPPWAQQGGSKPEPWHWEFWGALGLTPLPADLQPLVAGATVAGDPLFNTAQWSTSVPAGVAEANILSGVRALMNDEPFLQTLGMIFGASMREYCTAPNGDIIAWFPDYFGRYGTAGKIVVQDIELMDFTVDWTDQFLKTHMFTSGASSGFSSSGAPGGEDATAIWQKYMTTGIASIEFPEIMRALFGVTEGNDPYDLLDPATFLQKHGARPDYEPMATISNPRAVFWYALYLFQKNWAEQFSASVPMTFMPEAFPGMLMQVPTVAGSSVNFQAYIQSVSHQFDFRDGGGFTTNCTIVAPSVYGPGGSVPLLLIGER